MAQVCPYHERLQKDVNDLSGYVQELREWKAAQGEKQENLEEKLEQAIAWMKWVTGLSVTAALGLLGVVVTLLVGR
jgi:predicted PurR-regulated permease PerM